MTYAPMKKFIYILIFFNVYLAGCNTEADVAPGESGTFVKFFGNINSDVAEDMKTTTDGGFIFLSSNRTELTEIEIDKIHLVKTDAFGNIEWERLYPEEEGIPASEEESINLTGRSLLALEDGYIVVGDSIYDEESSNLYIMRTALDGNLLNEASLSIPGGNLKGRVIELTQEGGFIVLGQIENSAAPENMYLAMLNANLDVIWEQQYGIGDEANVSRSFHVGEQEITWAGTTIRNPGEQDIRFISTPFDSKNTFFDESVGLNNGRNDIGADIKRCPTGYVIVGTTNDTENGDNDMFLISISTAGNVLWSETFGGSGNDTGESVMVTSRNEIVALGTTESFGNGERDMYLVKTDLSGNAIWTDTPGEGRTFGGVNDEAGSRVLETADNGYLLLGTEDFNDVGTMILIKTDQDGNL